MSLIIAVWSSLVGNSASYTRSSSSIGSGLLLESGSGNYLLAESGNYLIQE